MKALFHPSFDTLEVRDVPEPAPAPGEAILEVASHVAWYSGGSIPVPQRKAAEEAVRGTRGEPPLNVVNGVTFRA